MLGLMKTPPSNNPLLRKAEILVSVNLNISMNGVHIQATD